MGRGVLALPGVSMAKIGASVPEENSPTWKAGTLPLSYSRAVEAILRLTGSSCQKYPPDNILKSLIICGIFRKLCFSWYPFKTILPRHIERFTSSFEVQSVAIPCRSLTPQWEKTALTIKEYPSGLLTKSWPVTSLMATQEIRSPAMTPGFVLFN